MDRYNEPWQMTTKVVDSEGKPLIVFHGSPKSFKKFATPKNEFTYFTASRKYAEVYDHKEWGKGEVRTAYLVIQNPLRINEFESQSETTLPEFVKNLDYYGDEGVAKDVAKRWKDWGDDYSFEPWEILATRDFHKILLKNGFNGILASESGYDIWVTTSTKQIKPVPAEVLKDYPDLAKAIHKANPMMTIAERKERWFHPGLRLGWVKDDRQEVRIAAVRRRLPLGQWLEQAIADRAKRDVKDELNKETTEYERLRKRGCAT